MSCERFTIEAEFQVEAAQQFVCAAGRLATIKHVGDGALQRRYRNGVPIRSTIVMLSDLGGAPGRTKRQAKSESNLPDA